MNQYESARIVDRLLKKRTSSNHGPGYKRSFFKSAKRKKELKRISSKDEHQTLLKLAEIRPEKKRNERLNDFKIFLLSIVVSALFVYLLFYLLGIDLF